MEALNLDDGIKDERLLKGLQPGDLFTIGARNPLGRPYLVISVEPVSTTGQILPGTWQWVLFVSEEELKRLNYPMAMITIIRRACEK